MELRAGNWTYRVVAVEAVSDPENPGGCGYCSPRNRTIELRVDQSFDNAFETLAHEYGHASEAAGIDVDHGDAEKRMTALAAIACAFKREYDRAGGDDALLKLLNLNRASAAIEAETPDVEWATLEGPALYSAVLRHIYCRSLSDSEFAAYRAEIEAKRLNPFLGECYPLRDKDTGKVMIGVKLPALRRLCREHGGRLGNYEWCGRNGVWRDLWIDTPGEPYPYAARCPIITADGELLHGVAKWESYAEYVVMNDIATPSPWWRRMGSHLLALCAERQAVGRVIPPMSNVVVAEEMQYRGRGRRAVAPRELEPAKPRRAAEDQRRSDEDEPTGEIRNDDDLRRTMARLGVGTEIVQTSLIWKVEKAAPGLREENPEAFYAAVLGEAKRLGGR